MYEVYCDSREGRIIREALRFWIVRVTSASYETAKLSGEKRRKEWKKTLKNYYNF